MQNYLQPNFISSYFIILHNLLGKVLPKTNVRQNWVQSSKSLRAYVHEIFSVFPTLKCCKQA